MLNQSLTLQPSSEGKHEYLEQKAFCIKIGKAKQLQEKMWPQDGTGCSSLEENFTQAAPNSQRSAKETARQEKHPCLLPGLSVTPKASPALHLHQEGPQTCSQEWASRGMASKGARAAGQEFQGVQKRPVPSA